MSDQKSLDAIRKMKLENDTSAGNLVDLLPIEVQTRDFDLSFLDTLSEARPRLLVQADQLEEFKALNANIPQETRDLDNETTKRLRGKLTRQERAKINSEWLANANNSAEIVAARSTDSTFVLNHLDSILATIPQLPAVQERATPNYSIGAFGLSLGGAIATELGKSDQRVKAVVNLDGGLYGPNVRQAITAPYLMFYSSFNQGSNDLLLSDAPNLHEYTLPHSLHTDIHDMVLLMPLLRWLKITRSVTPLLSIKLRNEQVREFFDDYM